MIDTAFIQELRELAQSESKDDQKKAKNELADYAKELGIKVKKTLSFENMVEFIEEELVKLESEMKEDESQESKRGTSITDLINAADTADGKVVFDEVSPELVKEFEEDAQEESGPTVEAVEEPSPQEIEEKSEETVKESEPQPVIDILNQEITHDELPKPEIFCDLKDFRPTITLIGGGRGYYTCPWWIFEWIQNNPDWKAHPERFPHSYVLDTLKSLIYYIKRDGSVKVRETKFSQFHTLK